MATSKNPSEVWYEGNCHCAAIKYKVKLPPLDSQQIMSCNCSICCKNGYLNAYPKKTDLIFVQGEDLLKEYQFGLQRCAHKFCPNCGSSVLIDPIPGNPDLLALNVRMIKDIKPDKLKYRYFDGMAKLDPPYEP